MLCNAKVKCHWTIALINQRSKYDKQNPSPKIGPLGLGSHLGNTPGQLFIVTLIQAPINLNKETHIPEAD